MCGHYSHALYTQENRKIIMAKKETELAVVEQKEVAFYGDQILAVRTDDGTIYVPVRPICDLLGVDWSAQRRRINRDPVLSEEVSNVDVLVQDEYRTITREMLSLPLDFVSGFLFGISAGRVKAEIRERLIRYQRECYKVLAEAFQEGRLTADPTFAELLERDTPAAQAYKMATAIRKMARQQLLLESRIQEYGTQLEDHEQRLEEIEATLGQPDRFITREQASRISQAVRAVGLLMTERTGTNQYGAVYGELYRRYDISAYRELPASKYEDAMQWLNEWRQSLVDNVEF